MAPWPGPELDPHSNDGIIDGIRAGIRAGSHPFLLWPLVVPLRPLSVVMGPWIELGMGLELDSSRMIGTLVEPRLGVWVEGTDAEV